MKRTTLVLIPLAALFLSACVSSGTQVKDSALKQFQKGITTEADVVRALGPPQSTTSNSDGTQAISYVGIHAQAKAASYIPIVGIFAGGADSHVSVVVFRFDQAGKLIDYTSQQAESGARTGIGAGMQEAAPPPKVVK